MSKFAGFSATKLTKPQRSQFDLSHQKRMSIGMGTLYPVVVQEAVPSDTFRGSSEILVRLAPLLAPIFDSMQLYVHFFFVPNRLLWVEWEDFITGGRLGISADPDTAPIPPYFDIGDRLATNPTQLASRSLADYMGVPLFASLPGYTNAASYDGIHCDLLPFMAYQKIWMDYYRDRNFVPDDRYSFPYGSGEQIAATTALLTAQRRNYEHDYFTSALPFTQRGEEVLMPLAGSGTVTYLDQTRATWGDGSNPNASGPLTVTTANDHVLDDDDHAMRFENIDEVLLDASSVSINDFRSAYALQVWLERNAVGGSRYVESTQAHFGVRPQDSRLQRAEYIGGGRIPIKISEIVSTAYSDDGDAIVPLANLAGHGISYGNTNTFSYFCPEHGFVMGIVSIMAPPSYHQGLGRMFRRRSFLDYPWPTFAKLGEQPVDKAEIFASAANLTEGEDGTLPLFGYQSRYADWKYVPSSNHADFHSSLLFWTLTRNFTASPTLSEAFNYFDNTVQNRIFAVDPTVSGTAPFWLFVNNQVTVRRPLPYFGTPNTLGFS